MSMSYRQLNFILIDPICYKQILIINIGPDLEVQHSPTWTVLGISLILKKKKNNGKKHFSSDSKICNNLWP